MEQNRVVVTGLGTVNAIARSAPEFSRALQAGRCGIGPVTVFDTAEYRTHTGGEIQQFAPREMIPRRLSLKRMSRADCMAMAATVEALTDAGLFAVPDHLRAEMGVVIGGGAGGMLECEAVYRDYLLGAGRKVAYSRFASFCCASSADRIASRLGLMGPKTTFMTACSSGATAIGYARDLIQTNRAPVVICGGTEPLCRLTYAAFNALQAVDPEYCRPFDKNRQGLSLGEGSGILILEALSHARQRGARIYGEILGYGVSCDAHHMTAPDPEGAGAALAMRRALEDAGVSTEAVDYINAHGTATPANDLMETQGIKTVFGRRAYQIPVSSTKSMIGHTLGAAGAIEGVAALLAIHHHFIPPTIHLQTPDPLCDLDFVTNGARASGIDIVLSNSFAFGGNNTAVVFGRFSDPGVPRARSGFTTSERARGPGAGRFERAATTSGRAHCKRPATPPPGVRRGSETACRRVVVTGVGLVTPLGVGKDVFTRQLFGGLSGIRPITLFDTARFDAKLGAQVRDFTPQDFIRPGTLRRMDRLSQMATAAARMAIDDAGFQIGPLNRDRVGVVLGTCFGGTDVAAQFGKVLFTDSPRRANPILVPNTVMNAPAGHAAIELGVRGVNTTVNHREVSAETAMAYAAAEIGRGRADVILAGGGDIISEFYFNVLTRFRTLSPQDGGPEGIRPFDARRNGTVVGEGAGIVCLESLESAEARGAIPYCEIAGGGLSAAPAGPNDWPADATGPSLAMTRALAAAGIDPGAIDYVCAAANGGRRSDRLEAEALGRVFAHPGRPPRISAIKGALGEGFSSGGIRAAAMALSIQNQTPAPTLGLSQPLAPLNFVLKAETRVPIRYGLVNGVSSGGTFAAVIMKKIC